MRSHEKGNVSSKVFCLRLDFYKAVADPGQINARVQCAHTQFGFWRLLADWEYGAGRLVREANLAVANSAQVLRGAMNYVISCTGTLNPKP